MQLLKCVLLTGVQLQLSHIWLHATWLQLSVPVCFVMALLSLSLVDAHASTQLVYCEKCVLTRITA